MNSSDEDAEEEDHGEEMTGVYTSGLKAPVVLSQHEAARLRAAGKQLKQIGYCAWINSDVPPSSTTSDWSQSVPSSPANTRCASRFDKPDTLKSQAIPHAKTPTGEVPSKPTVSTAVSMPPPNMSQKRQKLLSDLLCHPLLICFGHPPPGRSSPHRLRHLTPGYPKRHQSHPPNLPKHRLNRRPVLVIGRGPVRRRHHRLQTNRLPTQWLPVRKRAELAGCEVWSVQGKWDTCVACGHPSLNLGRNLFPPRMFSYHARFSGGKGPAKLCYRASPQGVDGTPRANGRKAVVRSSQSPRWGLTK
jgi:hypothetical protein